MPETRQPGRFSRIVTHVPARRPLATTPLFWIYIFAGIILAFVIATQTGLVPKTAAGVGHPDLNSTGRVDPAVPVEGERARSVPPPAQPAPIEGAEPVAPTQANSFGAPPSSDPKLVRTFEAPPRAETAVPKPAMPQAAEAPSNVADHVAPAAVQPAVEHPNVKVPEPPSPAPVAAKPDPQPSSDSNSSTPPQQTDK